VKLPNGRPIQTGWEPVAYFLQGMAFGEAEADVLCGVIGAGDSLRDMTDEEVKGEDIWSYCCRHPIAYDLYKAVAEDGEPWLDLPIPPTVPAANRDVAKTDNAPPPEEVIPPDVEHATAIDNAIAAAPDPKTVTSEAAAAMAAGSKNRIAELRLAATRVGEAAYKPPYNEYKRLHGIWTPMVARAERKEKELNTAILSFREVERKKAMAAAAEAARLQREQDEANERAAQRAIARGDAEMPPPVVEAAPALPPATAPVQPTYGTRKIKEEVKKFAVIEDWVKVFAHFQNDADLRARLEKLATDAIRAGAEVPGATHREGLI